MKVGTTPRTRERAMQQGKEPTVFAPLEGGTSRRSTVMRALRRIAGVTSEYQSDSSSKRPVVSGNSVSFVLDRQRR
jgi:hypothetical protein